MPVSLYSGEEDYLLGQAASAVRKKIVNPQLGELSHRLLEKPDIERVNEAVGAVMFNLGGMTLIEIRDFPFLEKASNTKAEDEALETLKTLLETLDDSKHVMFVSPKINRRIKFAKWLSSQKFVDYQDFPKLNFWQTDDAIQQLARLCKDKGIAAGHDALALLVENQGVSLRPLMQELEKLALYAGNRPITTTDVKLLCNHPENIFHMLADWVQGTNRPTIYERLDEILLHQHVIPVFALLQSYIGGRCQLREWHSRRIPVQEMAERLKKHPYKTRKDLEEVAHIPLDRLQCLRKAALDLEWKSKTGQLDGRLALEILLAL